MTSAYKPLANKVAIVSGSSTGIGAAIARELSMLGAHVVVNYPFPSEQASATSVLESFSTPGHIVEADIGTITGPQKLVDETVAKYGHINIVVNNAGLAVNKPFVDQTMDDWDLLVNLNGRGTFLLTQAAIKHFPIKSEKEKGDGVYKPENRIINICSISSRGPPPRQTIYAGTKGMVDSFTRCWAKELPAQYDCTVNSISPGPTRTEGFAAAGEEMMKILGPTIMQTPVAARMGETEEIAYAVSMLANPRASWINGVHIPVCGGLFVD